ESLVPAEGKGLTAKPCGIQIQSPALVSNASNVGGTEYVSFTFKLRNAHGITSASPSCTVGKAYAAALSNLTLVGVVEPGVTINGTPFSQLVTFNGTAAPASTALTILPTHGTHFDALTNAIVAEAGQESLQIFTESQIAAV